MNNARRCERITKSPVCSSLLLEEKLQERLRDVNPGKPESRNRKSESKTEGRKANDEGSTHALFVIRH
jgi:hypothetical protein